MLYTLWVLEQGVNWDSKPTFPTTRNIDTIAEQKLYSQQWGKNSPQF